MSVVRVALSGLAAIFATLLADFFLLAARIRAHEAASGQQGSVGFNVILIWRVVLSPWFWIIAILLFDLFFAASRLSSKMLRVLLFWIPTDAVSTLGFGFCSLIAYMWLVLRKG